MKNELNDIRLIEDYLLGNLNDAEQSEFKSRLSSDQSLNELFEAQQLILKGVNRIGLKQSIQQAAKVYGYKVKLRNVLWSLAIISIVGSGAYWLNKDTKKELKYSPKLDRSIIAIDTLFEDSLVLPIRLVEPTEKASIDIVEAISNLNDTNQVKPIVSPYIFEEKAFQTFRINNSRDTSLTGNEGTVINLKANSFKKVKSNTVILKLQEYYNMGDIVFSDLSTEAVDGQLLETGGMLNLIANDLDGNKLELKQAIELMFPKKENKSGMKLFNGVVEEKVIWKEQLDIEEVNLGLENEIQEAEIFTIVEEMPIFPGCEKLKGKRKISTCTQARLYKSIRENCSYPKSGEESSITGTAYIQFIVDESGSIGDVELVRGINGGEVLNEMALDAVKNLPKMIPGKQRGKAVKVQYTVPVRFGGSVIELQGNNNEFSKKSEEELEQDIASKLIEESDSERVELPINSFKNEIDYYLFSTSSIGWINCDRFSARSKRNISFTLYNTEKDIPVKIIFHRIKSLLITMPKGNGTKSPEIPEDERITLFSIKMVNHKPFVAFQETEVSKEPFVLEYKQVSLEEIKSIKKQLDELH